MLAVPEQLAAAQSAAAAAAAPPGVGQADTASNSYSVPVIPYSCLELNHTVHGSLGSGSFGKVQLAFWQGRLVAVKTLLRVDSNALAEMPWEEAQQRLLQEAGGWCCDGNGSSNCNCNRTAAVKQRTPTYAPTCMHTCLHTGMHTCMHTCLHIWLCDLSDGGLLHA